jgi:hypothetical protein
VGSVVEDSLNPGGMTRAYSFNAAAGDRVLIYARARRHHPRRRAEQAKWAKWAAQVREHATLNCLARRHHANVLLTTRAIQFNMLHNGLRALISIWCRSMVVCVTAKTGFPTLSEMPWYG